ncbi:hypothetical protein [Amnibacterium kyonggiense]
MAWFRGGVARRWLAIASVSAICVSGLSGCAAGRGGDEQPADGVPFAGMVPWNSAVIEPDGRTLHLLADWDHIDHFVCGLPNERVTLQQSAARVVITVRGYAKPLPAGVACGGAGSLPQPKTVLLARPLAHRALIDGGSMQKREVLADSSLPTITAVPAGYTAQPMTWSAESGDERTATRVWKLGDAESDRFLRLTIGLPTYYTFIGPAGAAKGTVSVHGSIAHIFTTDGEDQATTTIRWTTATGRQISLETSGTSRAHLSRAQAEVIARSVH